MTRQSPQRKKVTQAPDLRHLLESNPEFQHVSAGLDPTMNRSDEINFSRAAAGGIRPSNLDAVSQILEIPLERRIPRVVVRHNFPVSRRRVSRENAN